MYKVLEHLYAHEVEVSFRQFGVFERLGRQVHVAIFVAAWAVRIWSRVNVLEQTAFPTWYACVREANANACVRAHH